MMQFCYTFMAVVYPSTIPELVGHYNATRAFEWDPLAISVKPAGAPSPVLVGVKPDYTPFAFGLSSFIDVLSAVAFLTPPDPVGPWHKFVMPHARSMVLRSLNWARANGSVLPEWEASCVDTRFIDMVDLLNNPTTLDLAERRSWSVERLSNINVVGTLKHINNTHFFTIEDLLHAKAACDRLLTNSSP